MFETLKQSTADYVEIRITVADFLVLAFREPEVEEAVASSSIHTQP